MFKRTKYEQDIVDKLHEIQWRREIMKKLAYVYAVDDYLSKNKFLNSDTDYRLDSNESCLESIVDALNREEGTIESGKVEAARVIRRFYMDEYKTDPVYYSKMTEKMRLGGELIKYPKA